MNYLTPLQFRVLTYSAAPGLLMLYHFFVLREKFPSSTAMGQYLQIGFIGLIIGFEFLVRKDLKRAVIFVIGAGLLSCLLLLIFSRLHLEARAGFFHPYYHIFIFLDLLGMVVIRGLLLKDKFPIKTGLLTILIWYYGTSDLQGLSFIIEAVLRVITQGHRSLFYEYSGTFIFGLHQFLLPCFYYIILYFSENYLNNIPAFRQKFHSKILVMSAGEYVFFYSVLFMFLIGGTTDLGHMVEAFSHVRYEGGNEISSVLIIVFYMLCAMLMIVLSGYLLRNIMVARSLTIGLHNGFLYYLHCLPFLNLVPVLIYGTRKAVHTTPSENAVSYINRGDSILANWIIVIGALLSLFGLYQGYQMLQNLRYYSDSSVFKFFVIAVTGVQFIRLINFLRLRNSRKAVYVLFTINLLSVCVLLLGSLELVALRVGICYLSLYLLLEIFHPTLFGEDAAALPATE